MWTILLDKTYPDDNMYIGGAYAPFFVAVSYCTIDCIVVLYLIGKGCKN